MFYTTRHSWLCKESKLYHGIKVQEGKAEKIAIEDNLGGDMAVDNAPTGFEG